MSGTKGKDRKVECLEGVKHDRKMQGIAVEALVEERHR
jgi:hypothetical protein